MDKEADRLSELMRRYSRGEGKVFEPLYALMSSRLYRFCVRLARTRSDAEDLFQEAFLRIHRARAIYLPGANAMHWAFAIARSAHLDRMRYRRRRPEAPYPANEAAGEDLQQPRSRGADARARGSGDARAGPDVPEEPARIPPAPGGGPQRQGGGRRARHHA